jgi:hypothetical protein
VRRREVVAAMLTCTVTPAGASLMDTLRNTLGLTPSQPIRPPVDRNKPVKELPVTVRTMPPAARRIGWAVNWIGLSKRNAPIGKVWESLLACGARITRDGYEWAWVQQMRKGSFRRDSAINMAEDIIRKQYPAAGIESLRLLGYGNQAFFDPAKNSLDDPVQWERFTEGFAEYARQIVEDQPETRTFEIWNEWNLTSSFGGNKAMRSAKAYARFFVPVALAIRKMRPGAQILTHGLAISSEADGFPDNRYLIHLLNEPGVLALADGISLHPYYYSLDASPERLFNYLSFTRAQLMQEVPGFQERNPPFHITETGFATAKKGGLSIASHWGYNISETLQAHFLERTLLLAWALPYVQNIVLHNFVDNGQDPDNLEHNFGVLRHDLSPKPAFHRLAKLLPILHSATDVSVLMGEAYASATSSKEAMKGPVSPVYAIGWLGRPPIDERSSYLHLAAWTTQKEGATASWTNKTATPVNIYRGLPGSAGPQSAPTRLAPGASITLTLDGQAQHLYCHGAPNSMVFKA